MCSLFIILLTELVAFTINIPLLLFLEPPSTVPPASTNTGMILSLK